MNSMHTIPKLYAYSLKKASTTVNLKSTTVNLKSTTVS